jgi:hypothetical protein
VQSEEIIIIAMGSFGIIAGLAVIFMAMQSRRQLREMEHRERLAMIERGLIPSPEADPAAFERMIGTRRPPETRGSARARSAGIIMIGLGLAFTFMVTFAGGAPGAGVGIGGAFAVLGAAFLVNAMLMNRSEAYLPQSPSRAYPTHPAEPKEPSTDRSN